MPSVAERELSILNSIAQALNRSVALEESLRAVLAAAAELLGLETGWVLLFDEESGEPYLAAAQNLPPGLAAEPRRMAGWCHCLWTYHSGDLATATNVGVVTCSRLRGLVDDGRAEVTAGLRVHASVPLSAGGRRLGMLNVAAPGWRELSADELRLLATAGDMLSVAVERARLFARSAQLGAAEERNRLARELHDSIAQGMAAAALHLETAEALLDAGAPPERVRAAVAQALALTRAGLEEARRSVLDMRAAPLEGQTLAQALARLAAEAPAEAGAPPGVTVSLDAVGAERPLPLRVEVGLYRIAQEALANALRHAGARAIRLRLVTTPERVTLAVEDDGRGFDPAAVAGPRFGLLGMRERAKLLGGTLEVTRADGGGTRVVATVPLGEDA